MVKSYKEQKGEKVTKAEDLFYEYSVGAKPFLKWAGGKSQLLDTFQNFYPVQLKEKKIKTYYEPFLGGGSVFFDVVQKYNVQSAYLYDVNDELILAYKVIQKNVAALIEFLYRYQKTYLKLNQEKRKEYYYDLRTNFNQQRFNINYNKFSENWLSRAAQIIFLNKTCFNGLFRFNSKGEFNTPAGEYTNPKICDEVNLKRVSKVLELAEIKRAEFTQIKDDLKRDDAFVYFDPPYRPLSATSNFTSYSKFDFTDKDQIKLSKLFKLIDSKRTPIMLSNSDPKNIDPTDTFFDELYKDYNIARVPAKRMINSDASKRGVINEIVVTNYKLN